MTTEQTIIERIHLLPEYMHIQVIDYLEFLLTKYASETIHSKEEITPEHKQILEERYQKYKDNPYAGDTWENVKQKMLDKYAV